MSLYSAAPVSRVPCPVSRVPCPMSGSRVRVRVRVRPGGLQLGPGEHSLSGEWKFERAAKVGWVTRPVVFLYSVFGFHYM
jgi:hypothetical protein